MQIKLILIFALSVANAYYISEKNNSIKTLNKISFGSCYNGINKDDSRFDIFNVIDQHQPDLWIWLGDAAYIRPYKRISKIQKMINLILLRKQQFDLENIVERFDQTKRNSYYSQFDSQYPIIGIWDDNDFGENNGNKYFKYKDDIKNVYLNFLDEPLLSERRKHGRGIYTTYSFGDTSSFKTVRVILLDVRYDKSSYFEKDRDVLGSHQWEWLEQILSNAKETFILIGSGTQILPIDRLLTEAWYPESREKLFMLISRYKINGVIFLTGDIHSSQILRTPCIIPGILISLHIQDIGYHLHEITSSGLGHYCGYYCQFLLDDLLPAKFKFSDTISYYSFSNIDFLWGNNLSETKLVISFIDIDNVVRYRLSINYNELIWRNIDDQNNYCLIDVSSRFRSLREYVKSIMRSSNWQVILYTLIVLFGINFIIIFCFFVKYIKRRFRV